MSSLALKPILTKIATSGVTEALVGQLVQRVATKTPVPSLKGSPEDLQQALGIIGTFMQTNQSAAQALVQKLDTDHQTFLLSLAETHSTMIDASVLRSIIESKTAVTTASIGSATSIAKTLIAATAAVVAVKIGADAITEANKPWYKKMFD